jgi:TatD DNase family protein
LLRGADLLSPDKVLLYVMNPREYSWVDTHAHLADATYGSELDGLLRRCVESRVHRVMCVAVDADSSSRCIQLSESSREQLPSIWATVGIHPNHAQLEKPEDWTRIQNWMAHERVVALGETGLDKYWDDCPFEVQQANFERHWLASRETGLPVIVHSRDCETEMLDMLRSMTREGPLRGVMHSYCGSRDAAMEFVDMGLYISFSGMLTYKKNDDIRSIAADIPLDRILIETDCPYLSPEPKRAERPNEPAKIVHTADVLASVRQLDLKVLANKTTENALRLFSRIVP